MADELSMQTHSRKTFIQSLPSTCRALGSFAAVTAVVAMTFAASTSHADGVLSTDFVFQMNNQLLQTPDLDLSKLLNGSAVIPIDDVVVAGEAPINVSGISVTLNYKVATPYQYPKLGTEINLASTNISGTVNIAKLAVDAEGDRMQNGNLVHWKVNGLCTDIVVSLPSGNAKMTGALDLLVGADGLPTLTVPWFQMNWTDGAWVVQSMNCSGANNFFFRAKIGIEAYLKSSSDFAAQFKTAIDKKASDYQTTARTKLLAPISVNVGAAGLTAVLKPAKIISLAGEQFQVRGVMDLTFASGTYKKSVALTEASSLPTQTGFTLSLPKTFLASFNSMAYASGFYNIEKKGSEISSFQSLRTSNTALSIVWTEVTHVPMTRDFIFDFSPTDIPSLSSVAWDGNTSLYGSVDLPLSINTWVQNPTGSSYTRFNDLTTPISATYVLSFTQETAGPTLNIAFSKFDLKILAFWNQAYVTANPDYNSTFDAASIGTSLTSSMTTTPTQMLIGSFAVTSALSLKPSAFRKTGNWLLLDMTP